MPDPITAQDLYGPTPSVSSPPIPIEETPEIPVEEQLPPSNPPSQWPSPPVPQKKSSCVSMLLGLVVLVALAGLGVWSFPTIRQYIEQFTLVTSPPNVSPTPAITQPPDPFEGWKTYPVLMGSAAVPGLTFKLPGEVEPPSCDGTGCASQGTYLPGQTRFTVAAKPVQASLSSLSGAVITDVNGTAFISRDTTLAARAAVEFTGTFTGRTTAGYGFSQMHGYMVDVSPTIMLEINHFTPTGVAADFARDDALFAQIISTLSLSEAAITPAVTMPLAPTGVGTAPTAPGSATSSGY